MDNIGKCDSEDAFLSKAYHFSGKDLNENLSFNIRIIRNNYTEEYLDKVNQIQKVWKKQFVLN